MNIDNELVKSLRDRLIEIYDISHAELDSYEAAISAHAITSMQGDSEQIGYWVTEPSTGDNYFSIDKPNNPLFKFKEAFAHSRVKGVSDARYEQAMKVLNQIATMPRKTRERRLANACVLFLESLDSQLSTNTDTSRLKLKVNQLIGLLKSSVSYLRNHDDALADKVLNDIPDIELIDANTDGWVGVEDRLPAMNVPVMVYSPSIVGLEYSIDEWTVLHECPVDFSTVTVEIGESWSMHEFEEVTHWKPLVPPINAIRQDKGESL